MFACLPEAIGVDSMMDGVTAKAILRRTTQKLYLDLNTKKLSLSVASDGKRFKRAKTKGIEEAKKQNPPVNMKWNTNWAVHCKKGIIITTDSLFENSDE